MIKFVGTGALFADRAHSAFMEFTLRQYGNMKHRIRKKLKDDKAELPFNLNAFRADILGVMGDREDGVILCRYCRTNFTIEGIAVDHAVPLSKRGSPGLENLDYPCRPCNNRKGDMDPVDFMKLLAFLETIPLSRISVLKRLEQSVSLAAGARGNMATITELKKTGQWQAVQKARLAKKKEKESGLGAF